MKGQKMNMLEVTKLLGQAVREKCVWIETQPGGRGCYDFSYDPTYELEVGGHTITLSSLWCGESQNSGYCYRQCISVLDFTCRVSQLNGVAKQLVSKIPIGQDQEIASAAGVADLL